MPTPTLKIHLFGPLRALIHGETMPRVRTRSVEWLLALLALRHGRAVSRSWLAGTLWPESEESRALQNLRNDLVSLRKALGPESGRIRSPARDSLILDLDGAEVDVLRFDAAIGAEDAGSKRTAVELYTGPLLEGCYADWAAAERNMREEQCLAALEQLAERAAERGERAEAIRFLRRAESMDPLRDSVVRQLMKNLTETGDSSAAIEVYRSFRLRLRDHLLTEPEADTTQLYHEIRAAAREFSGDRPRLDIMAAPRAARSPLPHQITSLIGREDAAQEIRARVQENRLVTLVGGGGVGKTRLAIETAGQLDAESVGDTVWVELAPLIEESLVLPTVAQALGVRQEGTTDAESLLNRVVFNVSDNPLLLVLDNCEHLLDAVAGMVQNLLSRCAGLRVLATSRQRMGLTGEITWRVPSLAVADPDRLPADLQDASDAAMASPAVRLFVERGSAANSGFRMASREDVEAVYRICRRLDGIPLAIELAAARASSLTPKQIAERLDDRFRLLTAGARGALPRHKTLRALIDWSYDQLTADERALLLRLSVFVDGFTLEAAEAVGRILRDKGAVTFEHLVSLVEKSLVHAEENSVGVRYRMLETVRDYCREKLQDHGEEAEAGNLHLAWCLQLVDSLAEGLRGANPHADLGVVDLDIGNIRAAMAWSQTEYSPPDASLELGAALWPYWEMRGHHTEGREHLRSALSRLTSDSPERAEALLGAASLAFVQADLGATSDLAWQSLAHFRQQRDSRGTAAALILCGHAALEIGSYNEAGTLLEEAISSCRECRWDRGLSQALTILGLTSFREGRIEHARAQLDEALNLAEATGHAPTLALTLHNRGFLARETGDLAVAASTLERSLQIWRSLGHVHKASLTLRNLGQIARQHGDMEGALIHFEEAIADCRVQGNRFHLAFLLMESGGVHYVRADYESARRDYAESLEHFTHSDSAWGVNASRMGLGSALFHLGEFGRAKDLHRAALAYYGSVDNQDGIVWSLERLAVVESAVGDPQRAARLLGSASLRRDEFGKPRDHWDQEDWDSAVVSVRAALEEALFTNLWAKGHNFTMEQAVAYALAPT